MKFINRWLHNKNEVYLTLIVILIIIVLSLAVFVNNSLFVQHITSDAKEIVYPITTMTSEGYEFDGKRVTAITEDASLSYGGISRTVNRIQINCINELSDGDAISNLAYSTIDQPNSFTNIPFSIVADNAMLELDNQVVIANIKLSLTNKLNDSVFCENIILNPAPRFSMRAGRAALYIGIILLSSIILSLCSDTTLTKMGENLGCYSRWVFVGVLVVIDSIYPIIVTWDSGHYLWLANMFQTNSLNTWDPIRNAAYPLSLFLTESILGNNSSSFLIPMILAHSVFYLLSYEIVFLLFKPEGIKRLWVSFAIFVFIGLDPTIVGYYHTLLTEYPASMVAVMSSLVALHLYTSEIRSWKFYGCIVYFSIFVPLMWHIKQPYIGAALFPFMIASTLKIIACPKKVLLLQVIGASLLIAVLTVGSQAAWTNLLRTSGNSLDEDRMLSTWFETRLQKPSYEIFQTPIKYFTKLSDSYFVGSNYYHKSVLSVNNDNILSPSINRGFQNSLIAGRLFNLDSKISNLFYAPPYKNYNNFLKFTGSTSEPFNNYFNSRVYVSHFLYTTGFLLLPFYLLISIVLWLKQKKLERTVIIILLGTAFINAVAHTTFSYLDRYFFLGYPLVLLAYVIELANLVFKNSRIKKNIELVELNEPG